MIEAIIGSFIGAFMWDNAEFLHTAKQQQEEGYEWVYNPKARDPEVPAIPLLKPNGEQTVIWVLELEK